MRLSALLLVVCCCHAAMTADEVIGWAMDAAGATREEVLRRTRTAPASDRIWTIAVWSERHGDPADAARMLAGADDSPFARASRACLLVRAGDPDAAEALVRSLSGRPLAGVDLAACHIALAWLRHQQGDAAAAATAAAAARQALGAAVPEAAYETWRTRLVRHRIALLATEAERCRLGDDYLAFRAADRIARSGGWDRAAAAYAAVATAQPAGPFAGASRFAAAQCRFWSADAAGCMRDCSAIIAQERAWAPQALLLMGDALLAIEGDPRSARACYRAAIEALAKPPPATAAPVLTAAAAAAVRDRPPHDRDGTGYPRWRQRTEGTLWLPEHAPWLSDHLRYVALTRLALATWLDGDGGAAAALASAATAFDQVDREMTATTGAAGSVLLRQACATGELVFTAAEAATMPRRQRMAVALAEHCYLLYDWAGCERFLGLAERLGSFSGRPARLIAFLRGRCAMMRDDDERAIAAFAVAAGGRPDDLWCRARLAAFSIVHQRPDGVEAGDRMLVEVQQRLPGSPWAREALLRQATLWMLRDPPRSRRLFAQFSRMHPNFMPEMIRSIVADIPASPAEPPPRSR